jgi:hypothetical protein
MPIFEDGSVCIWTFEPTDPSEHYPWLASGRDELLLPGRADWETLCHQCKQLSFSNLFHGAVAKEFKWNSKWLRLSHGIRAGTLNNIQQNRFCTFCCLISRSLEFKVSCLSAEFLIQRPQVWLSDISNIRRRRLEITIREEMKDINSPGNVITTFFLQQRYITDSGFLLGQPANDIAAAAWRLLIWLDRCEQISSSISPLDIYDNLDLSSRIIDVHRRRVVKAPRPCRYIALSYVWGGRNFSTLNSNSEQRLMMDGGLDTESLPNTILDAVSLCRELGERYLWVDSLCIVQDSHNKHSQIKSMEAIYRGAVLTIVAAAGDHADVGLPGFSMGAFQPKVAEERVKEMHLTNGPADFDVCVDSSTWNSRAWTYQERLLSRRLLIFTEEEIYFQCDHGRAQCGSLLDPHEPSNHSSVIHDEPYRIQAKETINFNTYARIVKEYSTRSLSFPEDVENAIGGINKIMSLLFGGSEVLFGIPISILDVGLLWTSAHHLKPRIISSNEIVPPSEVDRPWASATYTLYEPPLYEPFHQPPPLSQHYDPPLYDPPVFEVPEQETRPLKLPRSSSPRASGPVRYFPSWTWMGWVCPVQFPNIKNLSERTISMVTWVCSTARSPLKQELFGRRNLDRGGHEQWLRQVGQDEEIYYTRRRDDSKLWFCRPMDPFIHDPIPINRETWTLHFRGSMATFDARVTPQTRRIDRSYSLYDSNGRQAGILMTDAVHTAIYSATSPSFTLIRISQTTLTEGTGDPAWDWGQRGYNGTLGGPPANNSGKMNLSAAHGMFDTEFYDSKICWCVYNVMAIEVKGGATKRIGIGKIHIQAFDKVAKDDQEICLS